MYTTLIHQDELAAHLNDPDWVIVDCRFDLANLDAGYQAYSQEHIAGAVYAHLDHDLSGPPLTDYGRHPLPAEKAMTDLFCRLGINPGSQVVVYDASGGAYAARLWWMLRYMGHEGVAVLDGGWQEWLRLNMTTRSSVENNPAGHFQGNSRRDRLVMLEQLSEAKLLVDSRQPERYAGLQEPIDLRAGHIPGALNFPYARNWAEDNHMLPAGQLREQFQALFGNVPSAETVFYCGSGVTACLNILAQVHAGMPEGKLYVGSWSEWCAEPDRPVATGFSP